MPAPSKNFTYIQDGAIDADSPLDSTLMTQIRDSLVHLEEWMGGSFTAAVDHDHDGINSKSVVLADGAVVTAKLADANVTLAKLKFSQGSYTTGSGGTYYINIDNFYTHLPTLECASTGTTNNQYLYFETVVGGSTTAGVRKNQAKLVINADGYNWTVRWEKHSN